MPLEPGIANKEETHPLMVLKTNTTPVLSAARKVVIRLEAKTRINKLQKTRGGIVENVGMIRVNNRELLVTIVLCVRYIEMILMFVYVSTMMKGKKKQRNNPFTQLLKC